MSEPTIKFRSGARISGVTPDVALAELERIRTAYGSIKPATVVEQARRKSSPLHPVFEWDDSIAAQEHRLWQARQLVRSIIVVREDVEPEPIYVHVRDAEGEGSYGSARVLAATDPERFAVAIADVHGRLASEAASLRALQRIADETNQPKKTAQRVQRATRSVERAVGQLAPVV